jgi:hypothetical protein
MSWKKIEKKRKVMFPIGIFCLVDQEMKDTLMNVCQKFKLSQSRLIRIALQKELDRRLGRSAWGPREY